MAESLNLSPGVVLWKTRWVFPVVESLTPHPQALLPPKIWQRRPEMPDYILESQKQYYIPFSLVLQLIHEVAIYMAN